MKKILLRSPAEKEKMVMLFPVVEQLVQFFGSDCEVNIIANEGLPNIFEFLSHRCHFYTFPKAKDTMMGIHHFCYNLNDVFNIDIYFDFENTYKSAFMGMAFRAHQRFGVKTGMNKMFLTDQVTPDHGDLYDSYYMSYVYALTGKIENTIERKRQNAKPNNVIELNPKPKEAKPIFIIMTRQNEILWKDFFDCFIDQKFLIWNEGDLDLDSNQWDERNSYEVTAGLNYLKVKELLQVSELVISDNYLLGSIASYLDCRCFVFSSSHELLPFYQHMSNVPSIVRMEGHQPIKVCLSSENVLVERMDQVVDKILALQD